ncbi:MAG TPA: hypothetical protein PK745_00215 [bacterium]|nr:hypothetical protein [bacterium]
MAKKPKSSGKAAERLINALALISHAQGKGYNVYETHCRIANGWISATDGKLSIGIPIVEDFTICPNTESFIKALEKTGSEVLYTVVSEDQLCIRSGRFTVYVDCVRPEYLIELQPDQPCALINNDLLSAMVTCATVADEKSDAPTFQGVWLCGHSVAASDRHSMFEVWHGIHLPHGMIIPKSAIKALAAHTSKLEKFGFSDTSATFWFEDGTFVKSALLEGKIPNYDPIFRMSTTQLPVPEGFFDGLRSILAFASDNTIGFDADCLITHHGNKGARFDVLGLREGSVYNGERLLALEKYAKTVDFYTERGAMFMGDKMRGLVVRRTT